MTAGGGCTRPLATGVGCTAPAAGFAFGASAAIKRTTAAIGNAATLRILRIAGGGDAIALIGGDGATNFPAGTAAAIQNAAAAIRNAAAFCARLHTGGGGAFTFAA